MLESAGVALGDIETFRELLEHNPDTDLRLWKFWYFGRIPWGRATVTPASLYASPLLSVIFDGELRGGGSGRGVRRLAELAQAEGYRQPHNQHVSQYALH